MLTSLLLLSIWRLRKNFKKNIFYINFYSYLYKEFEKTSIMKKLVIMTALLFCALSYGQQEVIVEKYTEKPILSMQVYGVRYHVIQVKHYTPERFTTDDCYMKKAITAIQPDKKQMFLFEYWQYDSGHTVINAYPLPEFIVIKN